MGSHQVFRDVTGASDYRNSTCPQQYWSHIPIIKQAYLSLVKLWEILIIKKTVLA
jgi:hypothetical protein